jgi:two-component sensor histidine kinase
VREVEDSVSSPEARVRFVVEGDPGELPGEVATPLAVVLNELMQNAVDHAFPIADEPVEGVTSGGKVVVRLHRLDGELRIEVVDDGVGLPDAFSIEESKGLGLSIVQTLVTGELGGAITMTDDDGARVQLRLPVATTPRVEL